MNRKDIILIIISLLIALVLYLGFNLFNNNKPKKAVVYYENNNVLEIDLSDKNSRSYTVKGYNGDVIIETIDGKVRVNEEVSPLHLCSKQGYISKSYETIICLPNRIVIEIEDNEEVDTVAR